MRKSKAIKEKKSDTFSKSTKIRYNIASAVIYVIGIVLLLQLFNLQIVHGQEYRQESNTRLTRETTLKAARGNMLDNTGNKLVTTQTVCKLEIYKSKIDNDTLNNTILEMVRVLEANGDSYEDNFPIKINPYEFKNTNEDYQKSWKKSNKIDEDKTAEECFNFFKERYKIAADNVEDVRKILTIRYEIETNGYSNTKPVLISEKISEQSLAQFNERNSDFPGISTSSEPVVSYPLKNLASHVLGTVGKIDADEWKEKKDTYDQNDMIGKTGLQYVFEEYLKGTDGTKQIDMAVDGTVTDEYISKEAVAGADVVLTIDANLQKVTEDTLRENIDKIRNGGFSDQSDAEAGAAVVLNCKTGEVLAMASYPDYEPELFATGMSNEKWNEYNDSKRAPLLNRAVASTSAPGSTFKMVTAIAGLETGSIDTRTKINDVGRYTYYNDYQPYCWNRHGHGWLNVTSAIEQSCNYFFYETGRRVGIDTLSQYAYNLGLGHKTGIELAEETSGHVASKQTAEKLNKTWNGGDVLQTAIGQSLNEFTPLQMAKYTSMIANGGKNIDVTLVKSIIKADGTEISKDEINKFVSDKLKLDENDKGQDLQLQENNINAIKEGMKGVTSDGSGTAYGTFAGFNIEVGGKTGSATIYKDPYDSSKDKTNAWFLGFAPYDDPEIAVVVLVDNGAHGGYTAPVAREIIAQYFGMNANQITEDMTAKPSTQIIR